MRLKHSPEEFVVREATDLRIRRQPAPYRVYMLEKKGWNTADALSAIAKAQRIPLARFRYGGKKDRYGHTFQYITVEHHRDISHTTPGYSLQAIGYATEPMGPTRVLTNRFELVIREVGPADAERLQAGIQQMGSDGFPNYFDDQRFGSFDQERGFILEQMLRGRWEEALAIALTNIHPNEKSHAKERKRLLRERWGDWAACLAEARTAFESRCFDLLLQRPDGFPAALATARNEELTMWVAAYQSFLWNEILRRLVSTKAAASGKVTGEVAGTAGPYRFGPVGQELAGTVIPVPGRSMRFPDPESGLILEEILRERRLRPAQLETEVLPGLWLKSFPRDAWVKPQSFWAEGPLPDEIYPGHSKFSLRFALPRGCYATMLIKALTI